MATILVFKTMARAVDCAPIGNRRSAEIVIFPGVRYERHDHNDQKVAAIAGGSHTASRARDRLELID
jgi:hypothetical protein